MSGATVRMHGAIKIAVMTARFPIKRLFKSVCMGGLYSESCFRPEGLTFGWGLPLPSGVLVTSYGIFPF